MHKLKRAHAQLEACACLFGTCACLSVSVHMLNWHAHAYLKVCACSTGSMHMLKWYCAHAHVALCTCSAGSMRAHAQVKACACATGSAHMLNWNVCMLKCKCAYAQLACTCSPKILCMLTWKACICSSWSVHMLNWKCAHTQPPPPRAPIIMSTISQFVATPDCSGPWYCAHDPQLHRK